GGRGFGALTGSISIQGFRAVPHRVCGYSAVGGGVCCEWLAWRGRRAIRDLDRDKSLLRQGEGGGVHGPGPCRKAWSSFLLPCSRGRVGCCDSCGGRSGDE